eukprot:m.137735 g.137735  ORF g.137735 m.137735 type:complete len:557 (-) comp12254_c0_seq1:99-1769(-)
MSTINIEGLAYVPQEHVKHCRLALPTNAGAHPFFTVMRNGYKLVHRDYDTFHRVLIDTSTSDLSVDTFDPVTGCTSLHYVSKAGGRSEQDDEAAAKLVRDLIRNGSDTNKQCLGRGMTPIMYAAFFNCPKVLDVLLRSTSLSGQININAICEKWDDYTALHFAVQGASVECVKVLLAARANTEFTTTSKERPLELAKSMLGSSSEFDNRIALQEIIDLLKKETGSNIAFQSPKHPLQVPPQVALSSVPTQLSAPRVHFHTDELSETSSIYSSVMDHEEHEDDVINVGDRVDVNGGKGQGLVRFKGQTQFKKGTWYGVQLDKPFGKNNGTVAMVTYFKTKPKHGVMVRKNRLTKLDSVSKKQPQQRQSIRKMPPHKSGRSPAPFTAPTFRTEKSVRPDEGQAKSPSKYTFSHRNMDAEPIRSSLRRQGGSVRKETSKSTTSTSLIQNKATTLRTTPASHSQRPKATAAPLGPLMEPFGIHSRVLAKGNVGTVQYVGTSDLGEGTYVGVAFSKEVEDGHDGMVSGRRYFSVAPNKGLLLPASKVHWRGIRVDKVLEDE